MTKEEFQTHPLHRCDPLWTKSGKYMRFWQYQFFNGKEWLLASRPEEANGILANRGYLLASNFEEENLLREDISLEPPPSYDFHFMTVEELKDICQRKGLPTKGNKDDLVQRVRRAYGRSTVH